MTPELLQTALSRALASIAAARGFDSDRVPDPTLRRPKEVGHGDWTSTAALRSAQALHAESRSLAEELAQILREDPGIAAVEVSGPGFLNITANPDSLAQVAMGIVDSGRSFASDRETAAMIDAAVTERIVSHPELPGQNSELGPDAFRYLAARATSPSSSLTAETSLLRTACADNPLYFVQSAHAAACRVERRAVSAGIEVSDFDPRTLTDATEAALLAALADFLATTRRAAVSREPQRITHFLEAVSRLFLDWSKACIVTPTIDEDITSLHGSRLVLDRAAIMVLATGLRLLGVSAPERM